MSPRFRQFLERHGPGAAMATATALMMTWGLSRVAFWLDEGAGVVATQRTWAGLTRLFSGADAPLVPYYFLLKALTGITRTLVPGLAGHPEILYRLPSVLAVVVAGWVLAHWLTRAGGPALAVSSSAVLLLTGGFSRYGQEVRPYAAVLLVAVVSTVAWVRLVQDSGRPRWLPYSVSVALLLTLHSLAAGLVLAHLSAALLAVEPGRRRPAVLRTVAAAVPGVLAAGPFLVLSASEGEGPGRLYPGFTLEHTGVVLARLISFGDHPFRDAAPVLLLAAAGLTRARRGEYRFVARLAACWAVVPLVAVTLLALAQPKLMFGRYVLYVVPGWAVLAGLGVVTLAGLAHDRTAAMLRVRTLPRLAAAGVVTVAIAATLAGTAWTLAQVRTPAGHGEDIRPALAAADRPQFAHLPIYVATRPGTVEFAAYRPGDTDRLIGLDVQLTEPSIWPTTTSARARARRLDPRSPVILLQRLGALDCATPVPVTPAARIESCLPGRLARWDYRVVHTEPSGGLWTFSVLDRPRSPRASEAPNASEPANAVP